MINISSLAFTLLLFGSLASSEQKLNPKKSIRIQLKVSTERCETVADGALMEQNNNSPLIKRCSPFPAKFSVFGKCSNGIDNSTCRFRKRFQSGSNGISKVTLLPGVYNFSWALGSGQANSISGGCVITWIDVKQVDIRTVEKTITLLEERHCKGS